MSGGSFNYAYFHVEEFADKLDRRLNAKADSYVEDGDGDRPVDFGADTIARLAEISNLVRQAGVLMKEVEYLFSGDNGEESFARNVAELLPNNPANPKSSGT